MTRRRVMGKHPSGPLFRTRLWFVVVVLASNTGLVFAGQTTSTQAVSSPSSKASSQERKSLGVELPAETKANILMARGEYAAAIAAFQQTNLKSAIVWNNIGMAYQDRKSTRLNSSH